MAYIWSYLRRYPKWLAMNFTAAILFVIANLGLPTVLARMIDEGINRGDADKLYTYAWVMFGVVLTGIVGRVLLSYAVSKLTTTMVQVMRNDIYAKLQEYSHHEYEQIGVSSLVTRITSDAFVLMQFAEQILKMGVITHDLHHSSGQLTNCIGQKYTTNNPSQNYTKHDPSISVKLINITTVYSLINHSGKNRRQT